MLQPTVGEITQVIVLNERECIIFKGHRSKGEGFTYGDAVAMADAFNGETTTWVGCHVLMHCVPQTLKDAKNDLRRSRDFIREQHLERIRNERAAVRQAEEEQRCSWEQAYRSSQFRSDTPESPRGWGYIRRADRYAT